ncbi:MAG: DNA internalization-related competence protein ComEC/Rec2 [Ignavibacteriales bacterium]|nr:DNA internalization-related competence protein ComEC/Rec2 [Ignavibacteriales bacterium]
MNKPAIKFLLPFLAGILIGWYVPLPLWFIGSVTLLFLALTFIVSFPHISLSPVFVTLTFVCAIIFFGVFKITYDTRPTAKNDVAKFINPNNEVRLVGTIVDPAIRKKKSLQLMLDVDSLKMKSFFQNVEGEILVAISSKDNRVSLQKELTYGKRVSLIGFLEQPSPARNPGDFDYQKYLRLKNIHALCFVRSVDSVHIIGEQGNWFYRDIVFPSRKWISSQLDTFVGGDEANFLKGLIVGDRSEITTEAKNAFINAGVMHILAVSGSNVLFLILIFSSLFAALRIPKTISFYTQCVLLVFYIFLTGESASVTRAVLMGIIFLSAHHFELHHDNFNTLAFAALVILLFDAKQLFDSGFQLSFAAVFSLAYFYPKIFSLNQFFPERLRKNYLGKNLWLVFASTFAATLGTLPFITTYFEKISLIGIITNLFVIPLSGVLLALGATVSFFSLFSNWVAGIYAAATKLCTAIFLWSIDFLGNIPYASIDVQISFLDSLLFYSALFLLFNSFSKQFRRRIIIFGFLLVNLFLYRSLYADFQITTDKLRITFLDVGQGDAIHIHFPTGENILVDAGPRSPSYDAGARVIVPYLKRHNISRLDALIVSHPHSDHLGGVPSILRSVSVDSVFDSKAEATSALYTEYLHLLDSLDIPRKNLYAGMQFLQIANTRLFALHPTLEYADTHFISNLNNSSVVFKLAHKNISVLFVGDAEKEAEEVLQHRYGNFLRSSLLKVGHHGSKTSTSEHFFTDVNPDIAVVSVGTRNKFRHPSKSTMLRLREHNVHFFRTDEEGAVMFESDGKDWKKIQWRM